MIDAVEYGKECLHFHSGNTFPVTGNEYTIKETEAMPKDPQLLE